MKGLLSDPEHILEEVLMKKNVKKMMCMIFALILAFSCTLPVAAQESSNNEIPVAPRLSHCSRCVTTFAVDDPGVATVAVRYSGYQATFVEAKVTIQIQKKFLGLFWKTVDIGYTNNEWIAYSNELSGSFHNTFSIDGTGTYRAKFKIEIRGTDGTVDVIEDVIERKYS